MADDAVSFVPEPPSEQTVTKSSIAEFPSPGAAKHNDQATGPSPRKISGQFMKTSRPLDVIV